MNESGSQPWYRPHVWTIVVCLIAIATLASGQMFGQYGRLRDSTRGIVTQPTPPVSAVRFGWPVVYQWRDYGDIRIFDDYGHDFYDMPLSDRWPWSDRDVYGFAARNLAYNIAYCLMLLIGVAYTMEKLCRLTDRPFRFGFVPLLAVVGWAATILVADGEVNTLEELITIVVRVLLSFRFLILALFWFALVDACCRLPKVLWGRVAGTRST